jgi:hypothetical protein
VTSKLRQVFVDNPDSVGIATRLNENRASVCDHGRDPCMLRCGVRRGTNSDVPDAEPTWRHIPPQERAAWLRAIENEITVTTKKTK